MKKIIIMITLLITLFSAQSYAQDAEKQHMVSDTEITMPELLTQKFDTDIVYGEENAPVTMVEYASLSCSHCGNFYEQVFDRLNESYIKTGKVKLVYRHFPLNLPALQAALVVECLSDDDAKKKFVGSLFSTQGQWAYTEDFTSKLNSIARIAGIDESSFNDCISDTEKEESILAQQLKAQQGLAVRSTPTFFINGKPYTGNKEYEPLAKFINSLL